MFIGFAHSDGVMMNNMKWVFQNVINNEDISPTLGVDMNWLSNIRAFEYDLHNHKSSPFLLVYQHMGLLLINFVRPILNLIALIIVLKASIANFIMKKGLSKQQSFILDFGFAYVVLILFHAMTFATLDRFIMMFDWIPVLIIGLAIDRNNGISVSR